MASNSTDHMSVYSKPPFDSFSYSKLAQAYYIISGILTIFGNGFLIFLFILYKKLRQIQCNWIIAYLSGVEVLIV
uniref:G-protein coupled receptors family 1 profile domain-containing protein n=1 Tax=Acrobeloides nanus TaxID=290746 RepID=A0A914ERM8_9BILA